MLPPRRAARSGPRLRRVAAQYGKWRRGRMLQRQRSNQLPCSPQIMNSAKNLRILGLSVSCTAAVAAAFSAQGGRCGSRGESWCMTLSDDCAVQAAQQAVLQAGQAQHRVGGGTLGGSGGGRSSPAVAAAAVPTCCQIPLAFCCPAHEPRQLPLPKWSRLGAALQACPLRGRASRPRQAGRASRSAMNRCCKCRQAA